MKETWNPAEISEDSKPVNYVNADSWNVAELNEAINLFGIKYPVDTWNPAELDEKARNIINDITSTKTITGNPISFKTINGGYAKSCEVTFSPIQSGSGDPSPSNVRPISGWDSLVLNVGGVNQWDEEWWVGTINAEGKYTTSGSRVVSKNFIPVMPNTTYCGKNIAWIYFYSSNNENSFLSNTSIGGARRIFTTPANAHYMRFYTSSDYGNTYKNDISVNYPSTDSSYHPYITPTTHTATFPDTVYGGKLDYTTGKLTVDYVIKRITYVSTIGESGKSATIYSISPEAVGYSLSENPFLCNRLKPSNFSTNFDNHIHFADRVTLAIYMSEAVGTTTSEWATYLNENPLHICYKVKTPTEITLTPETIALLKGNNVLWTNGDSIELKYTKLALPDDSDGLSLNQKVRKAIEIIKGKAINEELKKEETKKSTTKGRRKKS